MRVRTIIIDDEPMARSILEKHTAQIPHLVHCGSFSNAIDAMAYLSENHVDLILLDINMPELSGIEMIKSIANPPTFIFTTAHPEFAVEGFELAATDYLLKPISFSRFFKAIQRVTSGMSSNDQQPVLFIKADKKIHQIPFSDILYLEAYGDYVKVHCKEKLLLTKMKLKDLELELDDQFMRTHRSYIVYVPAVEFAEGNHLSISQHSIPVSKAYKDVVRERFRG